jgi:hypothetical protein
MPIDADTVSSCPPIRIGGHELARHPVGDVDDVLGVLRALHQDDELIAAHRAASFLTGHRTCSTPRLWRS